MWIGDLVAACSLLVAGNNCRYFIGGLDDEIAIALLIKITKAEKLPAQSRRRCGWFAGVEEFPMQRLGQLVAIVANIRIAALTS